jgi:VWFA-related protein
MRLINSIPLSFGLAALAAGAPTAALAQAVQPPAGSAGPGAAAATQGPAGASAPALQAYSRLIVVDVTATDNQGQPIHGLKKSDFTIKEDGTAQPVAGFLEVSQDMAGAQRTPPALPPNVYTNAQPAPSGGGVNILLLDTLNTASADQIALRQESIKYLKSMPPGARVAVLALGASLRVLQGFTSDPALLIAALDSGKNRVLPSPFDSTDIDDTLNSQIDNTAGDGTVAVLTQFQNEQSTLQADARNRITLEALNQIAEYVAGMKGRKNLIWFTGGIPLNISRAGGANDLQGMTDYTRDLRRTSDLLAEAAVAVYPVDAHALVANAGMDSKQKESDEQLSMMAVAEATGGVAYLNSHSLKDAVAEAIGNGSNYYVVSYVPPSLVYDGRHHSIDIEAGQPGIRLSYRKGYDADDIARNEIASGIAGSAAAPEPYGDNMQASMARAAPPSDQMLFDVRVAPTEQPHKPSDPPLIGELDPRLKAKPLVRFDLEYFFPTRQIAFTEDASGVHNGSLQFEVVAYDVYGKLITRLSQKRDLVLTADKYQQFIKSRDQQFFQQIDLPHGEIFLRAGILDGVSDKVGTLEIPLLVTKNSALPASQPGRGGGN